MTRFIFNRNKHLLATIFAAVLLMVFIINVMLPISPLYHPIPNRDSGVFLYTGWEITQGNVPYRDVWDHKPPMIFFLNALGLYLSGNSLWGVWALELICLILAAVVGFRLINRRFGFVPAVISSILWLITLPFVIEGGNRTTDYALPFQFLSFWLFSEYFDQQNFKKAGFFLGITAAILFFLKQTLIGIILSVFIALFLIRLQERRLRQFFVEVAAIFSGIAIVTLVLIGYFFINHALSDFWSAAFLFNFNYSAVGMTYKIQAAATGLFILSSVGLSLFALLGWTTSTIPILKKDAREWLGEKNTHLLLLSFVNLPVELVLVSQSGRSYYHYYMALLPVFSILSAYVIYLALHAIGKLLSNNDKAHLITGGILVPALLLTQIIHQRDNIFNIEFIRNGRITQPTEMMTLVAYLSRNTKADDYVLVFGAETAINFLTGRKSPSRYVYQYPLIAPGYATEQMVDEFFADIENNQPAFIIDSTKTNIEFATGSFPIPYKNTLVLIPDVNKPQNLMKSFFENNYFVTKCHLAFSVNDWDIYDCR